LAAVLMGVLAAALTAMVPVTATAGTAPTHAAGHAVRDACGPAAPGFARCFALLRTDVHGGYGVRGNAARALHESAADTAPPAGYGPADLRSAYDLPSAGGASSTVAIVDAGDDPEAEADLAVYRQTYGLPACTTANGCFRKVNQEGDAGPLPEDEGWAVEIALDLDMVSASCPNCHILLVEGDDPSFAALATAEDTAASLGATEISNSYGAQESAETIPYAADYSHPGVAITVSSGDYGYAAANFPADLPSVTAVGGTSLTKANNTRGWTESVWNSDGGAAASGCSAWVVKPSWQTDPNCPGRMVADVAADADPETGPAIYITDYSGPGWTIEGGTSAASPFIAGVIGLAGNPARYPNASYFYSHTSELNDATTGNNVPPGGEDCGGDYQCDAMVGYDGPTGLGTPNGIGAF
jgi:subtilase family serine protease